MNKRISNYRCFTQYLELWITSARAMRTTTENDHGALNVLYRLALDTEISEPLRTLLDVA